MQQVFQFFQRRRPEAIVPVPTTHTANQRILNFDFVDQAPVSDNVIPFAQRSNTTVGRTETCVSVSQLSQSPVQSSSNDLVYLQEELCQKQTQRQRTHILFQTPERSQKVRATALLDASELIKHRDNKTGAYQKNVVRPATNRLFNRKVAQQLNERSSRDELLAKVKDACKKVSSDALINAPKFHGYAAPSRHQIQIKIG